MWLQCPYSTVLWKSWQQLAWSCFTASCAHRTLLMAMCSWGLFKARCAMGPFSWTAVLTGLCSLLAVCPGPNICQFLALSHHPMWPLTETSGWRSSWRAPCSALPLSSHTGSCSSSEPSPATRQVAAMRLGTWRQGMSSSTISRLQNPGQLCKSQARAVGGTQQSGAQRRGPAPPPQENT